MGVVIKQAGISTVISYIGIVLGFVNVVYIYPYLLTIEEFGTRSLLIDGATLLHVFSLLGAGPIVVKFIPTFRNKSRSFYSTCLVYFLLLNVAFFYLFYSCDSFIEMYYSTNSPFFVKLIYLLPFLAFFLGGISFLEAIFRCEKKIIFFTYLREIQARILILILVFCYSEEYITTDVFWVGIVCVYGANFILLFVYALVKKYFSFILLTIGELKMYYKPILFYAMFSFSVFVGGILVNKIDGVMIGGMISESAVGIYVLAVFMVAIIDVPKRAILLILNPIIADFMVNERWDDVKKVYKEVSVNLQVIGGGIFLMVWSNIDGIYRFIPKGIVFSEGKYVVLFIGFAKLSDMIFSVNLDIIAYSKQYYMNFVFNIVLAILAIGTNYLLIAELGIVGAAVASFISVFVVNFLRFIFLKIVYGLSPFTIGNFYLMLLFLLILLVGVALEYYLPSITFLLMLFKATLLGCLYLTGVYFFKVSSKFNVEVNKLLGRLGVVIR